jgi:DNA invertase Pin-like site-specific DNA recombinase
MKAVDSMAKEKIDRNHEIVRLRDSGFSCQEIANKFGITKQRVQDIYFKTTAKESIGKIEKKTKWVNFYQQFIKEYIEGNPIHKIAEKYNCSNATVYLALKKAGISRREKMIAFV